MRLPVLLVALSLVACGKSDGSDGSGPPTAASRPGHPAGDAMPGHAGAHAMGDHAGLAAPSAASALDEVARVHGGAGPWAVAGYRMGQLALTRLGLPRQSFDLDVTHRGPLVPQYACVADGASAATGASVGKVNLRLEAAELAALATVYRRKSTGQAVALRPTEAFKKRFLDVPRDGLRAAGEQVLALRDDEIFEEVPLPVSATGATGATGAASATGATGAASASPGAPASATGAPARVPVPTATVPPFRPRPPVMG